MAPKKVFFITFVLIFLLGVSLRSVEVLSGDFVFSFDHGRDYLDIKKIVIDHKLTLIGPHAGIGGVFSGPGWYYLLSIPFIFWRGDPYGGVVLMLMLGLTTMLTSYWLVKKMFNQMVALLAFFFIAVSVPVFSQSTMIWNPHPAPLLILISFCLLFLYFRTRRKNLLILNYFVMALIYHFELTVAAAMVLYTSLFLFFYDRKTSWKIYLSCLFSLVVGLLPAVLFELRHQFLQTKAFINFFIGRGQEGSSFTINFATQNDHLKSFLSNLYSTFNFSGLTLKAFLLLSLALFIWTIRQRFLDKPARQLLVYLGFFPIATFSFYLFFPNAVWQWYLTHLYFVYIIIVSVVIYYSARKHWIFKIVYAVFILLMIINSFKILNRRYSHDYFDRRGTVGYRSKLEAIDYIFQQKKGRQFNFLVFTPPIYDYPYEYLIEWYAYPKYKYRPGKEIKGELMLLIEPDPSKPWTYEGWLETVIKSGKIIQTTNLKSGFIVQERYIE